MDIERGPDGAAELKPLREWGVTLIGGVLIGLLLDYAANDSDHEADRLTRLQLHLPADVAEQMGRALLTQAAQARTAGRSNPQ